jgi:hypothetical protein
MRLASGAQRQVVVALLVVLPWAEFYPIKAAAFLFTSNKLKVPLDLEVKAVLEVLTTSSSSLQSSRRWGR